MKRSSLALLLATTMFQSPALFANETEPSDFIQGILRAMEKKGAEAIPPIVIAPDARNFTDVEKEMRIWWERVLVQPALARLEAQGNRAWKDDAMRFLADAPPLVFIQRYRAKPVELSKTARQLIDAGCEDPAVLVLAALINRMCEVDRRFVEECAYHASLGLEADPSLKAILSYHANELLAWAYKHGGFHKKRDAALKKSIHAAVRMASDGSFLPNEAELYIRNLYLTEGTQELAAEMVNLAPELPLPEWARQTIIGKSEIKLAWTARGGGWAYTVTEEGWKGFGEHLTKAREALVEAWKENPKVPFAATSMITVVMCGDRDNNETVQLWFDRAIAAQCDYSPAYSDLLWAYRPRWCGGHELMLAFGKACAATKRYDLDIPLIFTHACNAIVSEIGDWREFYQRPDISQTLIELSEGLVNEPSREYERNVRQSFLAVNAWIVGDTKRAAAALEAIGGQLHPEAVWKLGTHRVTEAEMRFEIAMANSQNAADFEKASKFYEAGELTQAKEILTRIEPKAEGRAKEGIQDLLALVDIEEKLATGEWVKLSIDPGLRGWLQRGGDWTGTADGVLINTGTDSQGYIIHRARVGPDFEMKVEFSVDAEKDCCRRCDVIFGWYKGFEEPFNIASYGQGGQARAAAWIAHRGQPSRKVKQVKMPYKELNSLLLHSQNGKLKFTVNEGIAFEDYTRDQLDYGPADARVGVGNYRWCRMNKTFISNIEVRRLAEKNQ